MTPLPLLDGIFYVGKEEATRLNNFTVAVAGEEAGAPERYPMLLDVFHQLHCLVCTILLTPQATPKNLSLTCPRVVISLSYAEHAPQVSLARILPRRNAIQRDHAFRALGPLHRVPAPVPHLFRGRLSHRVPMERQVREEPRQAEYGAYLSEL